MDAYGRMLARRNGQERVYLHVTFLRSGRVEKERILEENYACRAMENWRDFLADRFRRFFPRRFLLLPPPAAARRYAR